MDADAIGVMGMQELRLPKQMLHSLRVADGDEFHIQVNYYFYFFIIILLHFLLLKAKPEPHPPRRRTSSSSSQPTMSPVKQN